MSAIGSVGAMLGRRVGRFAVLLAVQSVGLRTVPWPPGHNSGGARGQPGGEFVASNGSSIQS